MGVTWEQATVFASDEWCTIPFLEMKKTTSDRINDLLLQIPECLDLSNKLRSERKHGAESATNTAKLLERKALWLTIRFREYWKEYGDAVDPDYDFSQYYEVSSFQSDAKDWIVTTDQPVRFRDKFAATIIPDYDAGVVIANSILREATMDTDESSKRNIVIHSASILEAAAFLQKLGLGSGGNIALVFPLKTVALCTPSTQQEATSAMELAKWGKTRGVEGACEIWRSSEERHPI